MKLVRSGMLLTLAVAMTAAIPATADTLTGSQVTATLDYPSVGTAASTPVTAVVGPGVEFPSGSISLLPSLGGFSVIGTNIDVGASTVTFTFTQTATATIAKFNGYVFNFGSTAPSITGATLDPSSSYTSSQVGVGISGSDEVWVNLEGDTLTKGSTILIDLSLAPSPEPSVTLLSLFGAGLIGVAMLKRRKVAVNRA